MSPRSLLLIPAILAGGIACAAESPTPPVAGAPKPWTETFSMTLKGKERTYAVHNGNSYLIATVEDFADPAFLDQKDVVVNVKIGRVDHGHVKLYNLPKVDAAGPMELWRTRIDGDNVHAFGRVSRNGAVTSFAIVAVEGAPSDGQIIAEKLATVPANDYPARLAAAVWAKEMGAKQGNREYWLVAADGIISQVIDDAAAQAEAGKDIALLLKAMDWCQELLHDIPRAARTGSAAWIRQAGGAGAEEVAKRMRRWDLEFYSGQWRPRGEALAQEFQDRFAAVGWRDAEGYYKLGRWADANAEVLPRARELSYRSYQAGFRANPNHNGIRRELAMELVSEGGDAGKPQGDFKDSISGVALASPPGWTRTDAIDGDATWIDPGSDTAFITVKVLRIADASGDFKTLWASQLLSVQIKTGFTNLSDEKLAFTQGEARKLRYSYREGRYVRMAEMIVAQNPVSKTSVRIDAGATENEAANVGKQVIATFAKLVIPNAVEGDPGKKPGAEKPGAAPPAAPSTPGKSAPAAPAKPAAAAPGGLTPLTPVAPTPDRSGARSAD
jgi:hypothetical protein